MTLARRYSPASSPQPPECSSIASLCLCPTPLELITLNCNNWSTYLSFTFHKDYDCISSLFPHSLKHKVHSTNVNEWTNEQMIESRHEEWENYVLILLSPHLWKAHYRRVCKFLLILNIASNSRDKKKKLGDCLNMSLQLQWMKNRRVIETYEIWLLLFKLGIWKI